MFKRYSAIFTPGPLSAVNRLVDPHLQAPYAMVFTVGMRRALGAATVVDAAYVGTRGHTFRMSRTYNQPDRVTGIRPNRASQSAAGTLLTRLQAPGGVVGSHPVT